MLPSEFVAKVEEYNFRWKKDEGEHPGIHIYLDEGTTFYSRPNISRLTHGELDKTLSYFREDKSFTRDWEALPQNSWETKHVE